jgi:glycine betaine/choline ABC-type transport system substrate-binding protein
VEQGYNVTFKKVVKISEQLSFGAVTKGDADLNVCYTTDPNIVTNNFVVLKDTKNVFPVYNPAPVVRDALLSKSPAIKATLNPLASKLTTDEIVKLIKQVSVDHQQPLAVAKTWLQSQGLLPK